MTKSERKIIREITADFHELLVEDLKNKDHACIFLQVALDEYQIDGDKKALMHAFKAIAEAQGGVGWLAKETKLNREHLYYILSGKGNPRLETLNKIFKAFGFTLQVGLAN